MSDLHLLSIEKLLHLKYLRVSSCSITELPGKIRELQYLQTPDVRYTRIKELPQGFKKIKMEIFISNLKNENFQI
jgi:hypothetical protein